MRITSAYQGRAVIKFHEGNHKYTVSVPDLDIKDVFQPSVSSILAMKDKSSALIPWAVGAFADQARRLLREAPEPVGKNTLIGILEVAKDTYRTKSKDACDIGTAVHDFLEQELLYRSELGPEPQEPEVEKDLLKRVRGSIDAGRRFFDEHRIEIIQTEAPRWSPTYGYIGTGDLIAHYDGQLAILDYKTSKAIYSEYFLQTAAYQIAYEEEFADQRIVKRVIVHVGRDGELTTQERGSDTLHEDIKTFLALNTVFRWSQENQGKYSQRAPRVLGNLNHLVPQENKCQSM